jgi:outer membrane protein assembly factor BamB
MKSSLQNSCPVVLLVMGLFFSVISLRANDWPQWRGPDRNGVSKETGLLKEWPANGPKLVWQQSEIGSGYSTPAIVGDRIYLLSNKGTEDEFVQALDVKDGKQIWSTHIGKVGNPEQDPNFPAARSTPTVEGEFLYALGSDGDLACLETGSGKVRWQKNLRTDFGGKPGKWAYAESPLVDGDSVICTPGGSSATVVALDKKSGDVIWKCALPSGDEASYASAVVVESGGVRQYVQLVQKGLVGIEAKTGTLLWRYERVTSRYGANIPSPVADDNYVYAGSAGTGGGVVKLKAEDGKVEANEVYFSPKLPTAIGGAVKAGDYLYGTTAETMLCIGFATGDMKWQERAIGAASVLYADERLYLHGENGEVALVEPTPAGYHEKGRFTPPNPPARKDQLEKAWAYPVIANGWLYIRDKNSLWCYDVREGAQP